MFSQRKQKAASNSKRRKDLNKRLEGAQSRRSADKIAEEEEPATTSTAASPPAPSASGTTATSTASALKKPAAAAEDAVSFVHIDDAEPEGHGQPPGTDVPDDLSQLATVTESEVLRVLRDRAMQARIALTRALTARLARCQLRSPP